MYAAVTLLGKISQIPKPSLLEQEAFEVIYNLIQEIRRNHEN